MSDQPTKPTQESPQTTSDEGLDGAACSPVFFTTPDTDAVLAQYAHHLPNWLATDVMGALAKRLERERDQYALLLVDAMKWVYACQVENQARADMINRFEDLELTPANY